MLQNVKVAVFFGGRSNEHEISVITGMLAANLLRGAGATVIPVYLPREGGMLTGDMRAVEDFRKPSRAWIPVRLQKGGIVRDKGRGKPVSQVDIALNCCHGGAGEDGTLSALCKWHGIKFASPDTAVSALFMDKEFSKIAAMGLKIPVVPAFAASEEKWRGQEDEVRARAEELGFPLIVKPLRLGSSIGIRVAKNAEELSAALAFAFRFDTAALIEKYLAGKRDLNCAACRVNGQTRLSAVEEVFSDEEILTFSEKYEGTGARNSRLPAEIPTELAERIQEYTRRIYEAFHARGVVRADFLLAGDEVFFNELNTVPGSLSCYLFGETLSDAKRFLVSLVQEALNEKSSHKELLTTGILNTGVFSGGKGAKRTPR